MFDNKAYATTEHYYQAKKFDYPGASKTSLEYAEKIRLARTPNLAFCLANQTCNSPYPWAIKIREEIKQYEGKVEIREDWEDVKLDVMRTAVRGKFTQNTRLQRILLDTEDRELVEHTTRDAFWADAGDGTGQNWLGKILMEIRTELSEKRKKETKKRKTIKRLLEEEPRIKKAKVDNA